MPSRKIPRPSDTTSSSCDTSCPGVALPCIREGADTLRLVHVRSSCDARKTRGLSVDVIYQELSHPLPLLNCLVLVLYPQTQGAHTNEKPGQHGVQKPKKHNNILFRHTCWNGHGEQRASGFLATQQEVTSHLGHTGFLLFERELLQGPGT